MLWLEPKNLLQIRPIPHILLRGNYIAIRQYKLLLKTWYVPYIQHIMGNANNVHVLALLSVSFRHVREYVKAVDSTLQIVQQYA